MPGTFAVRVNSEAVMTPFFKSDCAIRIDFIGSKTSFIENKTQFHTEAAGVRSGDKFFWIRSNALSEAGVERVLCFVQHGALGGEVTTAILTGTFPNGCCFFFS